MLVKCLQNRGNVQNLQTLSAKQVYTLKKKKNIFKAPFKAFTVHDLARSRDIV